MCSRTKSEQNRVAVARPQHTRSLQNKGQTCLRSGSGLHHPGQTRPLERLFLGPQPCAMMQQHRNDVQRATGFRPATPRSPPCRRPRGCLPGIRREQDYGPRQAARNPANLQSHRFAPPRALLQMPREGHQATVLRVGRHRHCCFSIPRLVRRSTMQSCTGTALHT